MLTDGTFFSLSFGSAAEVYDALKAFRNEGRFETHEGGALEACVLEPADIGNEFRILIPASFDRRAEIIRRLRGLLGFDTADTKTLFWNGSEYCGFRQRLPTPTGAA